MNDKKQIVQSKLILASASPRRRDILKQMGLEFSVLAADVDEKLTTDIPSLAVEELSRRKALACLEKVRGEESIQKPVLILGADTVVACEGRILGKPSDSEDACRMLSLLQGRSHQVYTGVTLVRLGGKDGEVQRKTFYEVTDVHFYPMTQEEIRLYVDTGEPMDKAGAYGIQGLGARFIRRIEGDYNNVVGLPAARLYQEAKDWL